MCVCCAVEALSAVQVCRTMLTNIAGETYTTWRPHHTTYTLTRATGHQALIHTRRETPVAPRCYPSCTFTHRITPSLIVATCRMCFAALPIHHATRRDRPSSDRPRRVILTMVPPRRVMHKRGTTTRQTRPRQMQCKRPTHKRKEATPIRTDTHDH
mmetsp:Transcript_40114/g.100403  ORF Transcript_40114/g.100403 Transcript_40114/m.100403 type:complete len:156 (-) Transcript_40114:959-1426(-)